ncbi:MAG: tetratricopeptide repeat protein [Myxococcota bacterium]|nr:tetratricopeptide repeat protein [Myxococcota bacterium]
MNLKDLFNLGHLPKGGVGSYLTALALALLGVGILSAVGCSGNSQAQLEEVRSLHQAGQFDPSIAPLRQVLADEPQNPEANYLLGIALRQTGRPSLAVWPLQKAAENDDYAVVAGLVLATTLATNGANEEAIRASTKVLAVEPENSLALFTRGKSYLVAGKPEKALEDAETILETDPTSHHATVLKGSALIDLDRLDEAENVFQAMSEEAALADNQDDAARKCAALANFYSGRKKQEQAQETFQQCLSDYPAHPFLQQWASDYYVETGQPDRAIEVWAQAVETTPEDLGLRAKHADLLYGQGRVDEARAVLTESVELFDTPEAWRMLASFNRKSGDPGSARQALEEAMGRTRNVSAPMRFALADMLIEEGNFERAEQIADSLDEPAYKHLLRGAILLKQGQAQSALESFDAGLRLWPNNSGGRYLAGMAAEELGDQKRALSEYREAVRVGEEETDAALRLAIIHFSQGDLILAQQFAERHIRKRPYVEPTAHVIAARSSQILGDDSKAESLLNDLRVKDSHHPAAYVEFAKIRRENDGAEAALVVITESGLDLTDPENVDAIRSAAIDYLSLGQTRRALSLVDQAIRPNPESPTLIDLKGRVLLLSGQRAQAVEAFEQALALDAEFAPSLEAIGTMKRNDGDLDGAIAIFERAANADDTSAEPLYLAAQTRLMQGNQEAAATLLQAALDRDPTHAAANNDLAWILASSNQQLDGALELAKQAVRFQTSPETLDTLGYVYIQRGEIPEATNTLKKALDSYPESPSLAYRLGLARAAAGDSEGARAALTRALGQPNFPEAAAARAQLASLQGS